MVLKCSKTECDHEYNYVVYKLKCEPHFDLPQINKKYLLSNGLPQDTDPVNAKNVRSLDDIVPIKHLEPPAGSSNPDIVNSVVTNADGTRSYPLYKELAQRAQTVYYVGYASHLKQRIQRHMASDPRVNFLKEMDVMNPSVISEDNSGRSAKTLAEELLLRKKDELTRSKDRDKIAKEYDWIIKKIQNSEQVTRARLSHWIRNKGELNSTSISLFMTKYCNNIRSQAETDEGVAGTDLLEYGSVVTDSEITGIHLDDLRVYAYWQ